MYVFHTLLVGNVPFVGDVPLLVGDVSLLARDVPLVVGSVTFSRPDLGDMKLS